MAEKVNVAVSPMKVNKETKERVRLSAALFGYTQAEFVEKAVDEYLENHQDELKDKIGDAQVKLGG